MMILFINSIAGSEIIIILMFVLVFFGAKSIPGMSRTLGRGLRQIKDASQEVQNEIRKTTGDMRSEMNMKRKLDQLADDVSNPIKAVTKTIEQKAKEVENDAGLKNVIPHERKVVTPKEVRQTPKEDAHIDEDTKEDSKPPKDSEGE